MKTFRLSRRNALLIAILLTALLLRLRFINQPYVDLISWRQASTAMMAENFYKTNWNILYPEVNWNGPGPSYNGREFQTITYISALLYTLVGQQDWVGRLVALVFGVWGVFALYQLIRRVWDEKHALAGACVMAIMPISVFVERSFIPDPVMVALVTTSLWMLAAYLQTDRKYYLILAAVMGCWGFLTKLPGMIVGLPMLYAVVTILQQRSQLTIKKLLPLVLAGVAAVIPVVCYYLWARHLSQTYPPYHFAGADNWVWDEGIKTWLRKQYFIHETAWVAKEWIWGLPVICLLAIGLLFPPPGFFAYSVNFTIKLVTKQAPWFFHLWLVGFAVFYIMGAKELTHNFWNFHISSPAVAALAGRGLVVIGLSSRSRPRVQTLRVAALLIVMGISSFFVLRKLYSNKDAIAGYRMGKRIKEVKKEGDLVITIAEDMGNPLPIYYSGSRGWVFPPHTVNGKSYDYYVLPQDDQECIEILKALKAHGAVWLGLVTTQYQNIVTHKPAFATYVQQNHPMHTQTDDYILFQLNAAAPVAGNTQP